MSIRSRIIKVGFAKSTEIISITIVRLVSVPLFLWAWSPEVYGEWLILYSLLSYLSLGNLGFAQAAANEMTISVASGDRKKALETYQSTFLILLLISVVLLVAVTILMAVVHLGPSMGIEIMPNKKVNIVLFLFFVYVVVMFFMMLFAAGFRSEGLYHRAILFLSASQFIELLLLSIVLMMGHGPIAAAISMVSGRIIIMIAMFFDIRHKLPWLINGVSKASRPEMKRLLSPSLAFAAYPVGNTLINQGVIIGIGSFFGSVPVVVFSSIRTLTNLATRIYDLINQAFYPEMSMAWGKKNIDLLRKLHRFACQASFWLGVLAMIGLAVFGPWVFRIWTHGKVELNFPIFYGFVGLVGLRALWFTSYVVPSSINKHQVITIKYLLAASMCLGISLISMEYFGILGNLVGFVFLEILMIFFVLPISLGFTKDNFHSFLWKILNFPSINSLKNIVS